MADTSTIEWTDATWNPVTGCSLVSEGCRHCYAAQLAATRLKNHPSRKGLARLNANGEAKFTGQVRINQDWIDQPLRWARPRRIFVCAHGDLFHEAVPDTWIEQVYTVMFNAPHHTFQVLTKRPERMAAWVEKNRWLTGDGMSHVWHGTSVESSAQLDRLDHLRAVPTAVRFVSFEPLLGSVAHADLTGIHWAIVGGESGPHARPMETLWVEEIEVLCRAAGTAFFFKQWGGRNKKETGRMLHGQTYDEMPAVVPA